MVLRILSTELFRFVFDTEIVALIQIPDMDLGKRGLIDVFVVADMLLELQNLVGLVQTLKSD